jgi:integrase
MDNQQNLKTQNNTTPLSAQAQNLSQRTIPSLVSEFLRTKKSSQTKKAYQQDILHFFDKIEIGTAGQLISVPIYDLSTLIINYTESFKKSEEYREDRILNPRTINRKAYALSSFFEFLVANYGYPRNPVKVFIPYSTPTRTSTDDMTTDELNAFWRYVQDHTSALKKSDETKPKALLSSYQQLLIIGFLMLSLRRNEVANLRRDDRNTKKSVMTVFGKGQKVKYLPLPAKVTDFLQTYQALKITHDYISDYIFSPINNNRS